MHSFVYSAFLGRFGRPPPQVAPYHYDWDALIATYNLREYLSGLDHLIIDEGQNLPAPFFRWALRYGARAMTVFADEDQTTDSERSSIEEIVGAGMPRPMRLTENHRNTAEIADVAEHFHRSQTLPPGIPRRGRRGESPKMVTITSWEQAAQMMAAHFRNRGGTIGAIVFRKDHVVALHIALQGFLPAAVRVDCYTSNNPETSQAIQMLTPGLTVLTSEAVIGLEFDAVYLQDLSRSLPCRCFEDYRRMYMLCARARDSLTLFNGPDVLSAEQVGALPGPLLLER